MATTWNPADKDAAITLSNGNLTATSTGSITGVRAQNPKSSGKYYYEQTITTWANSATGLSLANMTANVFVSPGGTGAVGLGRGGTINVNGSGSGSTLGARTAGDTIGVAVDCNASRIWFRVAPSGNWNGSGTADPATGTGGVNFSAVSGAMAPQFYAQQASEVCTVNFGATAYSGTIPAGFLGWDEVAQTVTTPAPRPGSSAGGGKAWEVWAAEQKARRKAARKALGLSDDDEDEEQEDNALTAFLKDQQTRNVRLGSKSYRKNWWE